MHFILLLQLIQLFPYHVHNGNQKQEIFFQMINILVHVNYYVFSLSLTLVWVKRNLLDLQEFKYHNQMELMLMKNIGQEDKKEKMIQLKVKMVSMVITMQTSSKMMDSM